MLALPQALGGGGDGNNNSSKSNSSNRSNVEKVVVRVRAVVIM